MWWFLINCKSACAPFCLLVYNMEIVVIGEESSILTVLDCWYLSFKALSDLTRQFIYFCLFNRNGPISTKLHRQKFQIIVVNQT